MTMTVSRGCTECGWTTAPRPYEEGEEIILDTLEHTCPTITIPIPHVPFGPEQVPVRLADADYLRAAVRNIRHAQENGHGLFGSNLTNTVCKLLTDAADAVAALHEGTDHA